MLADTGEALPDQFCRTSTRHHRVSFNPKRRIASMSTCTQHTLGSPTQAALEVRFWHAVTTMPRHEKSVFAGLMQNGIYAFLPTFEPRNKWRNRQKVTVIAPLFPTYLFVRIVQAERVKVLRTPGVRQFVGNSKGPAVIPMDEVESLGKAVSERKARPF